MILKLTFDFSSKFKLPFADFIFTQTLEIALIVVNLDRIIRFRSIA